MRRLWKWLQRRNDEAPLFDEIEGCVFSATGSTDHLFRIVKVLRHREDCWCLVDADGGE